MDCPRTIRCFSFATALAASVALPAMAAAQDSAITAPSSTKMELATRIADIGYPVEKRENMFFSAVDQATIQMREALRQSFEQPDAGAQTIIDDHLSKYIAESKVTLRKHIPDIIGSIAYAYADMFSEQELHDIHAFVSTPSGQTFFERSPEILANPKFAAANQAYMNDVMAGLPTMQKELMAELMSYMETTEDAPAS